MVLKGLDVGSLEELGETVYHEISNTLFAKMFPCKMSFNLGTVVFQGYTVCFIVDSVGK